MFKRISGIVPRSKVERSLVSTLQQTGSSLGVVVEKFEKVLPKTQAEASVVQQRLIRAGYRKDSALSFFYGTKVLVPLALAATVFGTGLGEQSPFVWYVAALGVGYLGPDFWLGKRFHRARRRFAWDARRARPLVICEADWVLIRPSRTAQELTEAQPAVADELSIVASNSAPAGRAKMHGGTWPSAPTSTPAQSVSMLGTGAVWHEHC
jgi:tight adherence protein C